MRFFRSKTPTPVPVEPAPLPEVSVEAMQVVANAPLFNATDDDHKAALAYRAEAIARGTEQRLEREEVHPEQEQMTAEALEHAWRLVRFGKWTVDHVRALEQRLGVL
jgi:hypothetical protein